MKSSATRNFWATYHALPKEIQKLALQKYRLWQKDTSHPSLNFKKVGRYWSARVTDDYRAVGIKDGDSIVWFWVGTHADYNSLIKRR
jgi:hypothetical protein